MFIILYRWRIKSGKEQQFIQAWAKATAYFLENCDSLGSRLHRGSDGCFYAYAQWKSEADRENAFTISSDLNVGTKMIDAIDERFEPVILETLSDYLVSSTES